jgi:membrane protease YdiL (CAAX protease family)
MSALHDLTATLFSWFPQARATNEPSVWETVGRAVFPVVAYIAIAPLFILFFRRTWRELDLEAHEQKRRTLAAGEYDYRPVVLFVITAVVLTLQEYFGGRDFYDDHVKPFLRGIEAGYIKAPQWVVGLVDMRRFDSLYSYGWWSFARVAGYVFIPLVAWKIIFRHDSILDMGLRIKGFTKHVWIYLLGLAIVVPTVFIVSRSPDFGNYYPFYKQSSRSWLDLLMWEGMYFAQFFALEIFFRGFWLAGLKKNLGSAAIFAMCVPYCMIHYGKPYLEAMGAVVAGIFLGSISMRTKSIYAGFFLHITVALLMDTLALSHRGALPTVFWPPP